MSVMLFLLRSIRCSYWKILARVQFFVRGVRWPRNLKIRGLIGISARGTILLGEQVTIVNNSRYNRAGVNHPTQLVAAKGASLTIGDGTGISGASIYAMESIEIGKHVLIGANCHIYDTDFHPIDWRERRESGDPTTAAVKIEDDVWLAANVTVLKGVTIGARSVVAAGSVVTSDIPADVLAGGVPARVIRCLTEHSSKA
jgi:acetyltransferase-like isoleucine patch superfamily enzyme